MKNKVLNLTIITILIFGCSDIGTHDNTVCNEDFKSIKKTIVKKMDAGDFPSLSVAVIEKGKVLWMESFGYADKENKIEATPNTLYTIASISKPITATGVMKLVERGQLDLDVDIQTYLDTLKLEYYSGDSTKISCRNLLTHTSGLPIHFQYFYGNELAAIPDLSQSIEQYGIVISPPSSKHDYSNLGYGILGEVITKTTGLSFPEYMEKEVFIPLGMMQTTLDISSKTKNKLAKRYDTSGKLMPFSFSDAPGSSNVSTTIKDLIHFGMFHLGTTSEDSLALLSNKTIQSMQEKQFPDNANGRNTYGLGWFLNDTDYKYKMVYHAGGMDGVDAMIRILPEKEIVVAAISNQYTEYTHELTEQILLQMVPDLKLVGPEQAQTSDSANQEKSKEIQQSDLQGIWDGHIVIPNDQIPIELIFQEDGNIQVTMPIQFESMLLRTDKYEIQHKMLLNKWFFNNGHLMGWYAGNIPGKHLIRCPQTTLLNLEYKNEKLVGIAVALASNSSRMYYALSHYLELEKRK
ncbi:MAG: beta-lactamase family protein [Candidatus Marinimicrobia bacterium]|jgi:CubicO group peptidase (beta-lactamase class C family)|nr:beta-lactamase family protein [Candidatus Neomarinimicrobiota bacterium]MBT4361376.1 beta-lactamase family protein [Candidatus Neomarinimicrobiota bacterium]MBT4994598.1 beta-lactamase family protein [Candidatus Neomarinimicrobiota bacterium]MBT5234436.1 beta-lactamase family protein [Candidatus Neomarinimicrobiota bacterium]MBT6758807.1 beta-lactamase family protein [Candidatus Neomarinimicrobiota bacterium]